MKLSVRAALALTIPAAMVVTAYASPGAVRRLSVDLWQSEEDWDGTGVPEECRRKTRENLDTAKRRLQMKRMLADDVIAGRRTLADTAVLFADLNRLACDLTPVMREQYAGGSDVACAACQVFGYAQNRLPAAPFRRCAATARLTGDLVALFAADRIAPVAPPGLDFELE